MNIPQKLPYGRKMLIHAVVQFNFTDMPIETSQLQDHMYDLIYIKCSEQASLYRQLVVSFNGNYRED